MKTAVVSLTRNGAELAFQIGMKLKADIYMKAEFVNDFKRGDDTATVHSIEGSFAAFVQRVFHSYSEFVFVMACGIVVRAIAPLIRDKRVDPAVVVIDEKGKHAISLLSGHVGGANRLAANVAAITGGIPVITTATDVNHVIAFDVFAKENDCVIENFGDLKYISSELVNGGFVRFYNNYKIDGELPENIVRYDLSCEVGSGTAVVISNSIDIPVKADKALLIRPRNLIVGLGCRRGTTKEQIRCAIDDFLLRNGKSRLSVKCIATVDLKQDELGLLEYCQEQQLELRIISREEIAKVETEFTVSDFVKRKIGVAGVAEPCAVMTGDRARLICRKTIYQGITLALAEEEKIFKI